MMEESRVLETQNVFIDTSIFISQNYGYNNAVFSNLVRLIEMDRANLFITDITIKEIKSHIISDVQKANKAISKFKNDAKILRNTKLLFSEIVDDFNEEKIIINLNAQLDSFLEKTKVSNLSTSSVSIDKVFDKYFNKHAPFGEGKKKSEFPDAFVMEALNNWCHENDEKIYIVSQDNDLKEYCEKNDRLFYLDKLAKFIDAVEFHDEILAPAVQMLYLKNEEAIKKAIKKEFVYQGFILDDQDGDVLDIEVTNIEIVDMLLLQVTKKFVDFQFEVNIEYDAKISYDNPETMVYSTKDNIAFSLETIEETVHEDANFTTVIHVEYDIERPSYFKIDSIKIDKEFYVSSEY